MNKVIALGVLFVVIFYSTNEAVAYRSRRIPRAQAKRVWTVAEILEEKRRDKPKKPIKYCNGAPFKPCVCPSYVAREMQYRPSVEECGGNAGIALTGKYADVCSAVVRDSSNRDRYPVASDFGGCTPFERDELGLNKCSAFKVQKLVRIGSGRDRGKLHCLGASGYSSLFRDVVRVTAKLADAPDSSNDPIVRWCLAGSTKPLN